MEVFSNSLEETGKIAAAFAKTLQKGDVVLLNGEMGAGKTAFTKALVKALGVEEEVTSPTYAYLHEYGGKIYHFDFYRLSSGEEAEALGLSDYFYAGGISVVEWGCNVQDILPENAIAVSIEKAGATCRKFVFEREFPL